MFNKLKGDINNIDNFNTVGKFFGDNGDSNDKTDSEQNNTPKISPISGTPVADAFKEVSSSSNLQALDKDITDYNKTITALKDGQKDIYEAVKSSNAIKDPKWFTKYNNDTAKDITSKIESNLNNQLNNIKMEYTDVAKTNNRYRELNRNQDIHNTMLLNDVGESLTKLDKTAKDIATKSRIVELNQEYASSKANKINALKVGLILAFLSVFPLVLAMSHKISWLVFFIILTVTFSIYGIYLLYIFSKTTTDPYTSPYRSDFQAFKDWSLAAIEEAGDELTRCKPCPDKYPPDDTPSNTNIKDTDVYVGDNKGYVYYDGSEPQQVIN